MTVKKCNYTKTNFQADIKRKQAMFNRFKRRWKSSDNPTERKFLKCEATRVSTDLKQCCKRWQTWGFGGYTWITKNYNVTNFTGAKRPVARKTTYGKSPTRKTYGRKTTRSYGRSSTSGSKSRTGHHTRTSVKRRSYSAW